MVSKAIADQLIKNNILLQKKTTDLMGSMNKLTKRIDTMVSLFEKASTYIEKEGIREPVAAKLTDLLEQNKKIAKGLLVLEKYVREKSAFSPRR